jgi:hypothetical protein
MMKYVFYEINSLFLAKSAPFVILQCISSHFFATQITIGALVMVLTLDTVNS